MTMTDDQREIIAALNREHLPALRLSQRLGRTIEAVYRDLLHLEATGAAYVWARGKGNLWCAGDAIGQQ